MRRLAGPATFALFAAGGLLAVCGVLLVAGAGGDNGRRADDVELGGRHVSTSVAGAVALVLAAVAVGAAVALRRRLR